MSEPLIPLAMDSSRLLLMQQRAERGEPLAQMDDQEQVTASIKKRHAKTGQNGHTVLARSVGHKQKVQVSKIANFDDDGDEIERLTDFTLIDRYLDTKPGTQAALLALADVRNSRGC